MKIPVNYNSLTPLQKKSVREEYMRIQGHRCCYCGGSLMSSPLANEKLYDTIDWSLFPGGKEGFLKYPVHLHHDHKTGLTIGAVHNFCNAHAWYYRGE